MAVGRWPGRVAVQMTADSREGLGEWRVGDATLSADHVAINSSECEPCTMVLVGASAVGSFEALPTLADAARRALAMEAERAQPKTEPPDFRALDNALRMKRGQPCVCGTCAACNALVRDAIAKHEAKADATRRHNATCPRCHGPAYHGWGYAPTCEREGGCLAEREPRVALFNDEVDARLSGAPLSVNPDILEGRDIGHEGSGENGWYVELTRGLYATRDLAVTAWREAVLERAKKEAGK